MNNYALFLFVTLLFVSACVSNSEYQEALNEIEELKGKINNNSESQDSGKDPQQIKTHKTGIIKNDISEYDWIIKKDTLGANNDIPVYHIIFEYEKVGGGKETIQVFLIKEICPNLKMGDEILISGWSKNKVSGTKDSGENYVKYKLAFADITCKCHFDHNEYVELSCM